MILAAIPERALQGLCGKAVFPGSIWLRTALVTGPV
jgi:hypothetical protein